MRQMTETPENAVEIALFVTASLLVGTDLLSDVGSGVPLSHVASEALVALLTGAGALWSIQRHRAERREAAAWKARADELLQGLGTTVERQFAAWSLTEAESEVALLLLKGLSFKEVASVRDTSERTSREQARGVYRKAGVGGRAELSAWFFEDLLAPPEAPPEQG